MSDLQRPLKGAILFTPGDRPDRFDKGWSASGGALILDLEDGASADRKASAREAIAQWWTTGRPAVVRLNAVGTEAFADDVARLSELAMTDLLVPKVESTVDLTTVASFWPEARLHPLIESCYGLDRVREIAAAAHVGQLVFGALDMHADARLDFPQAAFMAHCRLEIMLASRLAGLLPPVDTPFPGLNDESSLANDAREAANLGFGGKLCIHPAQLAAVNAAFRPSAEALQWAREVLAADSSGAVRVRGEMVDAPVRAAARHLLARAQ